MKTLLEDLRYAARMLLKNPGFTAMAVLTLALGVGANTAIFSMVDWILLRPLPVKDPQQLTVLAFQQGHTGFMQNTFSIAEYRDMRSQMDSAFSDVFSYQIGMDGLSENGRPDRVVTAFVSGNFFSSLGLQPSLGRLILPSEGEIAGADPIVVLSNAYWQRRYGGDPGVVGRKISVDGHAVTIVGVAPKGFHGIHALIGADAFLPMGMSFVEGSPSDFMTNRLARNMFVLGRLRPHTGLDRLKLPQRWWVSDSRRSIRRKKKTGAFRYFPSCARVPILLRRTRSRLSRHFSWDSRGWCCCSLVRTWRTYCWYARRCENGRWQFGLRWARRVRA